MIEREELHKQLEVLEADEARTEEQAAQIKGAIRMVKHLIDVSCKKDIEARKKTEAEAGA